MNGSATSTETLPIWKARASAIQPRDELWIGDPAPRLTVGEFLKGGPDLQLLPGIVHVIDLWGSACGACKATMPKLSALQERYPDVIFLGIAVLEPDPDRCKALVDSFGDKVSYRLAIEEPDPAREGLWALPSGPVTRDWYEAACLPGVPESFIVDAEGRVAWWGHPEELQAPLSSVVAGTWDIGAARREQQQRFKKEATREQFWLVQDFWTAFLGKDGPQEALRLTDDVLAASPVLRQDRLLQSYRLSALARVDERSDELLTYARELSNTEAFLNPPGLYSIGTTLVQAAAGRESHLTQAIEIFRRLECLLSEPGQGPQLPSHEFISFELDFARALTTLGYGDEALSRLAAAKPRIDAAKAQVEASDAPIAHKQFVLSQISEINSFREGAR